jgi:hypothetical protein
MLDWFPLRLLYIINAKLKPTSNEAGFFYYALLDVKTFHITWNPIK